MDCLAFHTVVAIIEPTDSFRHLRFAFLSTSSEWILSLSFVLVMVLAVALMALLMSSVTPMHDLSILFKFNGIVAGQEDRIFPISRPFAMVVKT